MYIDFYFHSFQVAHWFGRLFPNVSYPALRIADTLENLLKKAERIFLAGEDLSAFLQNEVDFDIVSAALLKIGVKRGDLMNMLESSTHYPTTEFLCNQVIVDMENFRSKEGMSLVSTAKWIKKLTGSEENDARLLSAVRKLMHEYRTFLKKKGGVHDEKLSQFLAKQFAVLRPQNIQTQQTEQLLVKKTDKQMGVQKSNAQVCLQERVHALEAENVILRDTFNDLSRDKLQLTTEAQQTSVKLHDLQKEIQILQNTVQEKQRTISQLQPQKLKKLKNKIIQLKQHEWANKQLHKRLAKAKADASREKENIMRENRKLRAKLKIERQENERLHENICALTEELSHKDCRPFETRVKHDCNRFSDEIRKTVLRLQGEANVPASMCSAVISIVTDCLFDQQLQKKDLPTHQTTLNMLAEGHVLSSIQTTGKLLQAGNATLHTDGTSRDTKKYIGQQLTLDSGETISLGYQTVASEDASTLLEMTVAQLDQLSEMYSEYSESHRETIFKQLLRKITSLMSDRAAVMKRFNSELHGFVETQLGEETMMHFLHCNAHFLLGLSRECEAELKILEQEMVSNSEPRQKLGRDNYAKFMMFAKLSEAATSRVIRTASDLTGPRGDEKNGCRQDWLAFCDEADKESKMTSYRYMAVVYFHLISKFTIFAI